MTINLANFAGISNYLINLHDCPFDLDRAEFDAAASEWHGWFLRPLWDETDVGRRWRDILFCTFRLPVVESHLELRPVNAVRLVRDIGIRRYTLNGVSEIPGGIRMEFNEELKIEFSLSGPPVAKYEETRLPNVHAIYHEVLLAQSGPKIEVAAGTSSPWRI